MNEILQSFEPLVLAAKGLDLRHPDRARAELNRRFDPEGAEARALRTELVRLVEEKRIVERGAPPVQWGRVSKAVPETHELSIDVVLMSAPGPRHVHPNGEVDYCIAVEGRPTFDGHEPGWVVFPPGSQHTPTVSGGTMLIVYLLPAGAIEFLA